MAKSPTEKAIKVLKRLGYAPQVVERWNPYAKIRQDAWGFIDIIALAPGRSPLYLQVTSWDNTLARAKKIVESALARPVIESRSARVEVWGFREVQSRNDDNLRRIRLRTKDGIPYCEGSVYCHDLDLQ